MLTRALPLRSSLSPEICSPRRVVMNISEPGPHNWECGSIYRRRFVSLFFFSLLLFFDCLFSVCVFLLYVSLHIFGYCSVATFQIHTQLGLIQFQYERPGGRRAKKSVRSLRENIFTNFFFISGNRRFMITKKVFFFLSIGLFLL